MRKMGHKMKASNVSMIAAMATAMARVNVYEAKSSVIRIVPTCFKIPQIHSYCAPDTVWILICLGLNKRFAWFRLLLDFVKKITQSVSFCLSLFLQYLWTEKNTEWVLFYIELWIGTLNICESWIVAKFW